MQDTEFTKSPILSVDLVPRLKLTEWLELRRKT